MRRHRAANPKKRHEFYAANPQKYCEQSRKYRAANREKIREAKREYRIANPQKHREQNRKYRAANPEKIREQNRRYYAINHEKACKKNRDHHRFVRVARALGISLPEYAVMQMLERLTQSQEQPNDQASNQSV